MKCPDEGKSAIDIVKSTEPDNPVYA
ncbi:hypothetical protein SCARD494_08180 [Seiridium cardinale]